MIAPSSELRSYVAGMSDVSVADSRATTLTPMVSQMELGDGEATVSSNPEDPWAIVRGRWRQRASLLVEAYQAARSLEIDVETELHQMGESSWVTLGDDIVCVPDRMEDASGGSRSLRDTGAMDWDDGLTDADAEGSIAEELAESWVEWGTGLD